MTNLNEFGFEWNALYTVTRVYFAPNFNCYFLILHLTKCIQVQTLKHENILCYSKVYFIIGSSSAGSSRLHVEHRSWLLLCLFVVDGSLFFSDALQYAHNIWVVKLCTYKYYARVHVRIEQTYIFYVYNVIFTVRRDKHTKNFIFTSSHIHVGVNILCGLRPINMYTYLCAYCRTMVTSVISELLRPLSSSRTRSLIRLVTGHASWLLATDYPSSSYYIFYKTI